MLPLKIKVSLKIFPPVCFALEVPKKSITSLWIAGFLSIYWLPQRWFSSKESTWQCRRHVFDPWPLEEPTCHGATEPGHHNYWVCALELRAAIAEPTCHNYGCPSTWSPRPTTREATTMRSPCTATREEPPLAATREKPTSTETQYSQKKDSSGQQRAEQTRDEPSAGLPWWLRW